MVEAARPLFLESELEDLRCVVRLTVEFDRYLRQGNRKSPDLADATYVSDSIFSGVDSFCHVVHAYAVLGGSTASRIDWSKVLSTTLIEEFRSMFKKFELEENFEEKCRLLLDLFKLQIVFAGMSYDLD